MYWDPMYFVFALPGLLLAMWAQSRVQGAYKRYLQVPNSTGISGVQAAEQLLRAGGMGNVSIEGTQGELTDHYDPQSDTLRLSSGVANSRSVAAISIVAHEVGHAQQDKTQYPLLRLRSGIVPIVQISSALGPIVFFAGLVLQWSGLAWLGILLFSAGAVFSLLTLPVEKDASSRALQMLQGTGLVSGGQELAAAAKVLDAAAWTYVAAVVQTMSTLLYYVFVLMGSSRRRD